jgi:hypothetical protein
LRRELLEVFWLLLLIVVVNDWVESWRLFKDLTLVHVFMNVVFGGIDWWLDTFSHQQMTQEIT